MQFDDRLAPEHPTRPVAKNTTTVAGMFTARVDATPDAVAWNIKRAGRWQPIAWTAVRDDAHAVATFLMELGLSAGDKITIIGSTCARWTTTDFGGQLAGVVTVGAYPTLTAEQLAYIVDHSDSAVAFVESLRDVENLLSVRDQCPALRTIVLWDHDPAIDVDALLADHPDIKLVPWDDVLTTPPDTAAIHKRVDAIAADACAIIVYTSGTTGPPKGAMISHANILCVVSAEIGVRFDETDHALSFLPMAHVAERILGAYVRLNHGTATSYASSIPAVLTEVKEVKPTIFGSVPRLFEKAYDHIHGEVARASSFKQAVFAWASAVGHRSVDLWQNGRPLPLSLKIQRAIADRLVFSKLREAFGGRVKVSVTGAAPIPKSVLRFFWGAGFRVFEAYGMTEGTVLSHVNRPGATRLGSVGQALPYTECKLADDGEILVRGGMVFLGYHKNEDATREAVDADGWLHTGDVGRIDDDGYLFIVDRKKHLIITAGGKNLAPANIENEVKSEDPLISQVHAHGDRRPYVTALVTLSPLDAVMWASTHGLLDDAAAVEAFRLALIANPLARPEGLNALIGQVTAQAEVRERVVAAVKRGNARLARVEQIKRVMLLDRELSVADNELTPTLKVRRKHIESKFSAAFDSLYEDEAFGLVIDAR